MISSNYLHVYCLSVSDVVSVAVALKLYLPTLCENKLSSNLIYYLAIWG